MTGVARKQTYALYDLLRGEPGGIDLDGIPGWLERAVLTAHVAFVTLGLLGEHNRHVLG